MEHRYRYNSYTSKPLVNASYPIIDVNHLIKNREEKEIKNVKKTISIEEYAEIIVSNTEKERGYKFPSQERRRVKKQVIKDIKKGKYKLK